MEQTNTNKQPQTAKQPEIPAPLEKTHRKKWELTTIKWLQIALDYNLFRYGGKGDVLK